MSCGGYHTLAVTDTNSLYGWGENSFGQCGFGEKTDSVVPRRVPVVQGDAQEELVIKNI